MVKLWNSVRKRFRHLSGEAISNLLHAKMRSILTVLGILIGTASVVALVSSGELATQHALEQFRTLGTNLLAVSISPQGGTVTDQTDRIEMNELPGIRNSSPAITEMAPYTNYYGSITYNGTQIDGGIIGATEELQDVIKIPLEKGRFVSNLDNLNFYCVIGDGIARKIRSAGGIEPIGQQILVGSNYYTIIGVAQPWQENMFMYADIDNSLIVPLQNSFLLSKYVQIQNIVFKLRPNSNIDQVVQDVTVAVNKAATNQQIFPRSPKQLIESMQKQRQTLTLLLAFIGGISLIVGGIGVMNIMLVSIAERRHEIGIRMAIGARGVDIGLMFIAEAVVLTVFGGLLGVLIGVLVSYIAAKTSGWEFHFFLLPPLVGFLVSAMVGIFSGTYPAYAASQLDPIDTLRSE